MRFGRVDSTKTTRNNPSIVTLDARFVLE